MKGDEWKGEGREGPYPNFLLYSALLCRIAFLCLALPCHALPSGLASGPKGPEGQEEKRREDRKKRGYVCVWIDRLADRQTGMKEEVEYRIVSYRTVSHLPIWKKERERERAIRMK